MHQATKLPLGLYIMVDRVSEKTRSYIMSRVRQKNTGPELIARGILHRMGYRYRLHSPDLPGSPDIVFKKRRKVIFVHGCFWHGHECRYGKLPKSKNEYWVQKIDRNKARDKETVLNLQKLGWRSLIVWQCELKNIETLQKRLVKFLGSTSVG